MMLAAAAASRPDVGSSRKTTCGRLESAMASESRRFCPPDRPLKKTLPALVFLHDSSPVFLMSFSTRSRCSALVKVGWYMRTAYPMWSRGLSGHHSVSVCCTTHACRLYVSRVNSLPPSATTPRGSPPVSSSINMLSSVVLPAPEGPMMARTEPASTVPERSSSSLRGTLPFSPFFFTITVKVQFLNWKSAGVVFLEKLLCLTIESILGLRSVAGCSAAGATFFLSEPVPCEALTLSSGKAVGFLSGAIWRVCHTRMAV
mmetsp:Transcript_11008/g.23536  ORF Transcript_11008/g.23536 Transcript_11008/m.23536 type:complete len:259 (-) Transcript_11008:472-1248(-)